MDLERLIQPRTVFGAIFLATAGLLAYGLWLQHAQNLEPCPMCILQRYAFAAAGLIAVIAALHNPKTVGVRIYAGLTALMALAGGGVAARQTWLQHNPPKIADCGPGLEFMVESFPLSEALPMIFRGSGDCSKVDWTFLGLSIAEWALTCFAGIVIVSLVLALQARTASR
jgi:protein dithiol:quinone oxidoreductase